jgi:ATP-dependent RNA helicase RhlE
MPPALQGATSSAAPTGSGKTAPTAWRCCSGSSACSGPAWRRTTRWCWCPRANSRRRWARRCARWRGFRRRDPVKVAVVFGGVSVNPQMMGLRGGADVVVATPGRLLDLVGAQRLKLDDVETAGARRGRPPARRRLCRRAGAPEGAAAARRQNLFFSATFPPAVQALAAAALLHDPVRVDVAPRAARRRGPPPSSSARSRWTPRAAPAAAPPGRPPGWPRVLVFVATRYASEHVADKLRRAGLAAAAFHGDLSQGARTRCWPTCKRRAAGAAGHRHGRARPAHRRPAGGGQLRPAALGGGLHAPHRPHRARRRRRVAVSFVSAATEAHFRLIEKRQGQRVPREQVPASSRWPHPRSPAPPSTPTTPKAQAASRAGARARRTSCERRRAGRPDTCTPSSARPHRFTPER